MNLNDHSESINAVAVIRDGSRIFSASMDNTLKVWDMESGELLHTFEGKTTWVNGVAFTPDGMRIILSDDGSLVVLDIANGDEPQ